VQAQSNVTFTQSSDTLVTLGRNKHLEISANHGWGKESVHGVLEHFRLREYKFFFYFT
jgi:hypothetical protein